MIVAGREKKEYIYLYLFTYEILLTRIIEREAKKTDSVYY